MVDKINIDDHLDIFSTDDDKLKILAKIISNKSSIKILNLLFQNELTANEIALQTNMSLQLVKYYLEKMREIELVHVSRTEKSSKSRDMNYYKTSKLAIIITPSKLTEKTKQSKLLTRSFHSISRILGIGAISALSAVSLIAISAESSLLSPIKSWYSEFELPIKIQGTGIAGSLDESFHLAKTKVDSVVANPGGGSGTPLFDPYSNIMAYTVNDFILTITIIGVLGTVMSLPFFLMSYRHSKKLFQKRLESRFQ
ncbi:MAG: winged helix-turn-helix domain-containing protein [Nitrosopumilaceae archaeon]|nr:winged helix-turn-helix domain-containing protein [Nitrosopumilaceae archaeon]